MSDKALISVALINDDYHVLIKALLSTDENLLLGNYSGGRKVYLATALVAVRRSGCLNPGVVRVERSRAVPLSKKFLSRSLLLSQTCRFSHSLVSIATTISFQSRHLPLRPLNIPEL